MGQNKLKDQVVGDSWENKLLYCLLLNEKDPKVYDMKVTRLQQNIDQQINLDQEIDYFWVFKTPLSQKQLTNAWFHHQYIVLKSQNWWWSFEKVADSLILQRSDRRQRVVDQRLGKNRCSTLYWKPQEIYIKESKCKTRYFINSISNQYMNLDNYHILSSNCKHFVDKITKKINQQSSENIPN